MVENNSIDKNVEKKLERERVVKTKIQIRYADTDKMGIIHNSNYMHYGELGRLAFLDYHGFPEDSYEERGITSPVVDQYVKYIKPARLNDEIYVKTFLIKMTRVVSRYMSVIVNSKNELLAMNITRVCFTDFNGRPVDAKKYYPEFQNLEGYELSEFDKNIEDFNKSDFKKLEEL